MDLCPRFAEDELTEALADTRVVFLRGPRQAGKSTLVKELIRRGRFHGRYVTLDDAATEAIAASDPRSFVEGLGTRAVIDEIQRVPELVMAIKTAVDADPRPGRFLLTGSANVLVLPQVAGSLAGRMETVDLWPLSQGEIERRSVRFVDSLFGEELSFGDPRPATKTDVFDRALRGGYPEAVARRASRRRDEWFGAYVSDVLRREVRDLANIEGLRELPHLLRLLAARSAGLLNTADLARDAELSRRTLVRYLTLLEQTFLVHIVPTWTHSLTTRLVKAPKVALADSGLAAHLNGITAERLERDPALAGSLVETLVLSELRKQIEWSDTRPRLHHFRTYEGAEVDALLESRDGRIAGVEVKVSATIGSRDLKTLRALAAAERDRFAAGVILYAGSEILRFGERLWTLPLSALWVEAEPERPRGDGVIDS